MSSRFFQVTVVPTFTVSCAGSKVKLSIITLVVSVARAPLRQSDMAAAMANRPRLRRASDAITNFPLALQRGIDDGEALIARLEVDAGNTEQAAELVVGDLHRPWRGGGARRRLRKRGRARGREGEGARDLLPPLGGVGGENCPHNC